MDERQAGPEDADPGFETRLLAWMVVLVVIVVLLVAFAGPRILNM